MAVTEAVALPLPSRTWLAKNVIAVGACNRVGDCTISANIPEGSTVFRTTTLHSLSRDAFALVTREEIKVIPAKVTSRLAQLLHLLGVETGVAQTEDKTRWRK